MDSEFKNYYNKKDRKFTVLNLEIRPLTLVDGLILSAYVLAVSAHFLLTWMSHKNVVWGLIFIPMTTWFLTVTTTIGTRFRGLYFFIAWLTLSIIFAFTPTFFSLLPLASFILYQALRFIFWKKHKMEFIPFELQRSSGNILSKKAFRMNLDRFVSKTEGRGGYVKDRIFMKWLVYLGFLLFFSFLSSLVGYKP